MLSLWLFGNGILRPRGKRRAPTKWTNWLWCWNHRVNERETERKSYQFWVANYAKIFKGPHHASTCSCFPNQFRYGGIDCILLAYINGFMCFIVGYTITILDDLNSQLALLVMKLTQLYFYTIVSSIVATTIHSMIKIV